MCLLFLFSFLFSSYGSGGGLMMSPSCPVLGTSSLCSSASALSSALFTPSCSALGGPRHDGGHRGRSGPIIAHPSIPTKATPNALVARSRMDISSTCGKMSQIMGCSFARQSIPRTFSNFHVTFVSSFRCGDLFGRGRLTDLIHLLVTRRTSMLLVKKSCRRNYRCMPRLFTTLSRIGAPVKACNIVNGGSCRHYRSSVIHRVRHCNVHILRRQISALGHRKRRVLVTNIHGPFSLGRGTGSPALSLSPRSFIVLLIRAPSCIRSISITGASLTLTKRARNKRIYVFNCTPVVPSRCKDHFLAKLGCGATGVPVVIAGNLNASGEGVHVNTPARIIIVALRRRGR